jgi:hypothetical protein
MSLMLEGTERLSCSGGCVRDLTGPRRRARPRLHRHGWLRRHAARMLCRQNGAANLKCRHDVECCLATSSRKLGLSFGCADKGLSGVGRQCFYLALLIALSCPCSRLRKSSGPARELPRHSGGFHVCSGRAPPIIWHSRAGSTQRLSTKKWGWTTKNWPSDRRRGCSRKGSGEACLVTVERIGGGLAALVYQARAARFGYCWQQLRGYERGTPRG